jgi:hypothetical protein
MSSTRFLVANSAGAAAWASIDGLAGFYLGKGFEKFGRPAAMALAVIAAIAIAGVFLYGRRIELAALAERAMLGPLLGPAKKGAELTSLSKFAHLTLAHLRHAALMHRDPHFGHLPGYTDRPPLAEI